MTNEPPDDREEPQPPPAIDAEAVPTEAPVGIPGQADPPAPPPAPRARLTRSQSNRVVSGVAGGLAKYFDVDATLVRVAIVVLTIISGGAFALIYIAAIIIMPRGDDVATAGAGGATSGRAGVNAIAIVFGLILIVIGASRLLAVTDLPDIPWTAVLSAVLALIGVALVVEARRGMNGGLIVVGLALTAVLAFATSVPGVSWDSAFGDRLERPAAIASLESSYDHAFGSMTLDLRDIEFPDGLTRISVGIAFGDLSVRLPADVAVRVTGNTAFGSSAVMGRRYDGLSTDVSAETAGYAAAPRRVEIDLSNAFGSATVQQ